MKKIILGLVALLLLSFTMYCQNTAFDEVFDKYALKDGFVTVDVSGRLLNMLLPPEEKIEEIKIGNIKVLSVENPALNSCLNFYYEIIPKLNLNDYWKLLHIKGEDSQVVIMKKKNNKGKQEFLLVTGGDDNTMIYIEGDLDFSEVNKISKTLNSDNLSFTTSSN